VSHAAATVTVGPAGRPGPLSPTHIMAAAARPQRHTPGRRVRSRPGPQVFRVSSRPLRLPVMTRNETQPPSPRAGPCARPDSRPGGQACQASSVIRARAPIRVHCSARQCGNPAASDSEAPPGFRASLSSGTGRLRPRPGPKLRLSVRAAAVAAAARRGLTRSCQCSTQAASGAGRRR